ncbi:unnamed protein product [Triticum turgidum subsp. durum]|uniref:Uncharacterized protein n=1 Tax=Triticum turgidum subsp. durum TaxID=4567 RepID=A0A9R0QSG3_TRITD|nr:unnamed protein product [Triticum turgidum subsp. durum]
MSVVGFDLGNESCIVGVARQRGIDVVLNEESKRETPAIVCFGDKQRFIGTAGAANSTMNPKNSISQIKRLLGRKFADPELQDDIKAFPFRVSEGPDGFPLVHVRYLGEERSFTPTQLLAMVLSNLKAIAEGNLNSAVIDCCIGIPVYFTDLQRRAVIDAATIAGLRPLRLFHETTATALAYGIYKTDLPENDQLNVAFVDVGNASMQVSIVGYKKGQLKMLSHAYDRSLGGRDFDEALFKHFAAKFKEEYKIDVYQNARACIRLRVACEKLKKMLSANPEAPMNIECLMDEKDVRGFIKRDEFEQISAPVLERVKGPLEKALSEAGLTTESLHFVEVVGSGSRVPAVMKIITEFFGKEPRRTMNASECVARGCALQCAILSPTFKVREFQVNEGFPFSVALSWKPDAQNNESQQTVVFPKGNPMPSIKALTFYRSSTFAVDVLNVDTDDLQITHKISTVELEKAVEKEYEMALQDRVMEETKDKKNSVEAYVYDMRNKIHEKYNDFVMSEDIEGLMAKLQEVEDWLYEDGEDETKGVYVAKLEELKKLGGPIEMRYKEWTERGPALEQLVYCIRSFREAALSGDQKFDHIDESEKQKVVNECSDAETWLTEKKQQQDALPKHANPVLLVSDIKKKAEALDRFCKPIMTKPRPAPKPQTPPPAETPSPEAQTPEQQSNGADESAEPASDGAQDEHAVEQMDTDKDDPSQA